MSQNTSSAVMQQRQDARDALEDFPTPPWAGRALIEKVIGPAIAPALSGSAVTADGVDWLLGADLWEPACNRGYLAHGLQDYFRHCTFTDVHDYGWGGQSSIKDFLIEWETPPHIGANGVDWIITNPPFVLAAEFIERACRVAREGVAMLCRTAFLEGQDRYTELFSKNPPSIVAQFAERVVLLKGRCADPDIASEWNERKQRLQKPTTATAYAWFVWMEGEDDSRIRWIPPCRTRLTRVGDYDSRGCAEPVDTRADDE